MTVQEKLNSIDDFEAGGRAFEDTLSLSEEVLRFRPFPEAWTIHEHIVHFLESDLAGFHRYRRAIAQPDTQVLGYDEEVWTPALQYHTHDLKMTVELIRLTRSYVASHLRTIAARDWTAFAYTHSSFGRVNLESWLTTYIDHVRFHRELIERNISFPR